jgi:hypothetical protein
MKRNQDELMTRIMDGSLDDTNGPGSEFAALKADLRSLRDMVPTPHLTKESLAQRIEAAKANTPKVPLWQTGLRFGLAPAVLAGLGFIAIRANTFTTPIDVPVADSVITTAQSDPAEVPGVAAAKQEANPVASSGAQKETRKVEAGPLVRKAGKSAQTSIVRNSVAKRAILKSAPMQKASPVAATEPRLVEASPEVSTNAVVIGNMTSETGTRVATEVEPTSDVVISG